MHFFLGALKVNGFFALSLPYKNEKDKLVGQILSDNHFVDILPRSIFLQIIIVECNIMSPPLKAGFAQA